jgi:hypothetical protein
MVCTHGLGDFGFVGGGVWSLTTLSPLPRVCRDRCAGGSWRVAGIQDVAVGAEGSLWGKQLDSVDDEARPSGRRKTRFLRG